MLGITYPTGLHCQLQRRKQWDDAEDRRATAVMDRLAVALRRDNSPSKARLEFCGIGSWLDRTIRFGNSVSRGTRQANAQAASRRLHPMKLGPTEPINHVHPDSPRPESRDHVRLLGRQACSLEQVEPLLVLVGRLVISPIVQEVVLGLWAGVLLDEVYDMQ